jgi:hypothetical protein
MEEREREAMGWWRWGGIRGWDSSIDSLRAASTGKTLTGEYQDCTILDHRNDASIVVYGQGYYVEEKKKTGAGWLAALGRLGHRQSSSRMGRMGKARALLSAFMRPSFDHSDCLHLWWISSAHLPVLSRANFEKRKNYKISAIFLLSPDQLEMQLTWERDENFCFFLHIMSSLRLPPHKTELDQTEEGNESITSEENCCCSSSWPFFLSYSRAMILDPAVGGLCTASSSLTGNLLAWVIYESSRKLDLWNMALPVWDGRKSIGDSEHLTSANLVRRETFSLSHSRSFGYVGFDILATVRVCVRYYQRICIHTYRIERLERYNSITNSSKLLS